MVWFKQFVQEGTVIPEGILLLQAYSSATMVIWIRMLQATIRANERRRVEFIDCILSRHLGEPTSPFTPHSTGGARRAAFESHPRPFKTNF
mgnify:FL=1